MAGLLPMLESWRSPFVRVRQGAFHVRHLRARRRQGKGLLRRRVRSTEVHDQGVRAATQGSGGVERLRLVLGRGPLLDGCQGGRRGCCVAPHALRAGSAILQSVSAPVAISATPVATTW
eukprot:scaffold77111_cov90-Phaeocystis_antarctica.AAC.1